MLWKNLQISVEQKKDLRSTNHYFPVFFFLSILSAVALVADYVRIFVPPSELEHVISQTRPMYSRNMLLDQHYPESVEKHFSKNRRDS